MIQTVSSQDARERFDALLDSVREKNETVVLEAEGEMLAAVISPAEYERYLEYRRQRAWDVIQQVKDRNASEDEDAVLAHVAVIVDEVRQERRARTRVIPVPVGEGF